MQNFVPTVVVLALLVAYLERGATRSSWEPNSLIVATALLAVLAFSAEADRETTGGLRRNLEIRRALRSLVEPGDTVLLRSLIYPLGAEAASYYPFPLVDSPDRLNRAIRSLGPRWGLPQVTWDEDILRRKPVLIDAFCLVAETPGRKTQLERLLSEHYTWISPTILLRNDRLPNG